MRRIPTLDLSVLRKLSPVEVRLLWVNDWYDGPHEAVVEHSGAPFLMVIHDPKQEPFSWVLFRLDSVQLADEERWHALFVQHVGDHWCMHETPHPPSAEAPDPDRFFEPLRARAPVELRKEDALGWLDEMPTR